MIDYDLPGILIYGAGGQAKVLNDAVLKQQRFRVVGFVVDEWGADQDRRLLGAPVFSLREVVGQRRTLPREFIVGIGDNAARKAKTEAMEAIGFEPVSIVHPFSSVASGVQIGRGVLISAGAVIDTGVTIGDGTIINVGAAVGHDTHVGSFAHIGANTYIGARCRVESLTVSGMGATVISGANVGRNCFLAAGALVTKDVPDDVLALGAPARFRARNPIMSG
jgi:UDP-perosamine 4-acetyltransferase